MSPLIIPDREFVILSSAARTISFNTVDFVNRAFIGLILYMDVTVVTGTNPTLDLQFETRDPISGFHVAHGGPAQTTGVARRTFIIHPAITEAANSRISRIVAQRWRLAITIGGTSPSFTFSIGGSYSP